MSLGVADLTIEPKVFVNHLMVEANSMIIIDQYDQYVRWFFNNEYWMTFSRAFFVFCLLLIPTAGYALYRSYYWSLETEIWVPNKNMWWNFIIFKLLIISVCVISVCCACSLDPLSQSLFEFQSAPEEPLLHFRLDWIDLQTYRRYSEDHLPRRRGSLQRSHHQVQS